MKWRAAWAAMAVAIGLSYLAAHSLHEDEGQFFGLIAGFVPTKILLIFAGQAACETRRADCGISKTLIQNTSLHNQPKVILFGDRRRHTPQFRVRLPIRAIIEFIWQQVNTSQLPTNSSFTVRWGFYGEYVWVHMKYRPHLDRWNGSYISQADLKFDRCNIPIDIEKERAINLNGFDSYPRSLSGPHYLELTTDMMISAFECTPLEKCRYSQSSSCYGQYPSPPNEGARQPNNRAFTYIVVGLCLIIFAYFSAWGAVACAVYWTNRRGRRLISAALLVAAVLLVYQGMTLIGLGMDAL